MIFYAFSIYLFNKKNVKNLPKKTFDDIYEVDKLENKLLVIIKDYLGYFTPTVLLFIDCNNFLISFFQTSQSEANKKLIYFLFTFRRKLITNINLVTEDPSLTFTFLKVTNKLIFQ